MLSKSKPDWAQLGVILEELARSRDPNRGLNVQKKKEKKKKEKKEKKERKKAIDPRFQSRDLPWPS